MCVAFQARVDVLCRCHSADYIAITRWKCCWRSRDVCGISLNLIQGESRLIVLLRLLFFLLMQKCLFAHKKAVLNGSLCTHGPFKAWRETAERLSSEWSNRHHHWGVLKAFSSESGINLISPHWLPFTSHMHLLDLFDHNTVLYCVYFTFSGIISILYVVYQTAATFAWME